MIEIILTIAHVDHDPRNNDNFERTGRVFGVKRSNLRAWCQRCHNRHDALHRACNAATTRARKFAERQRAAGVVQGKLFKS